MRTLGLIGGTSWHSTIDYYRVINQQVNERLGGLHSARLLLYSVNFEELQPPADPREWGRVAELLAVIAKKLEHAGAECIVLCANTPHIAADTIQNAVRIPLIHIAEETAREIARQGMHQVGLLGTKITMEQPFFKDRLSRFGITSFIPGDGERELIHASILAELAKGIFKDETRQRYLEVIEGLRDRGAEAVIFGCTEIALLIKPEQCALPVFDTALLHAKAAVEFALGEPRVQ